MNRQILKELLLFESAKFEGTTAFESTIFEGITAF